jgi:uncharacterized protein YgiB involved in biofilm formation
LDIEIISEKVKICKKNKTARYNSTSKNEQEKNKAAPYNPTREDCEENFRQNKAENRRNTLCISRFDNEVLAEISRKTP